LLLVPENTGDESTCTLSEAMRKRYLANGCGGISSENVAPGAKKKSRSACRHCGSLRGLIPALCSERTNPSIGSDVFKLNVAADAVL
jgi:hypothetical protein